MTEPVIKQRCWFNSNYVQNVNKLDGQALYFDILTSFCMLSSMVESEEIQRCWFDSNSVHHTNTYIALDIFTIMDRDDGHHTQQRYAVKMHVFTMSNEGDDMIHIFG